MTWRALTEEPTGGSRRTPAAAFGLEAVVRRIVDGLLRGYCLGKFLCSRCLVKLTTDHLDKSYSTGEIAQAMQDIFSAPGLFGRVPTSTCAACATRTTPCLGVATL